MNTDNLETYFFAYQTHWHMRLNTGIKVDDYTLAFCNYHDGSSNIRFFENYHPFHFFEYPAQNHS